MSDKVGESNDRKVTGFTQFPHSTHRRKIALAVERNSMISGTVIVDKSAPPCPIG